MAYAFGVVKNSRGGLLNINMNGSVYLEGPNLVFDVGRMANKKYTIPLNTVKSASTSFLPIGKTLSIEWDSGSIDMAIPSGKDATEVADEINKYIAVAEYSKPSSYPPRTYSAPPSNDLPTPQYAKLVPLAILGIVLLLLSQCS